MRSSSRRRSALRPLSNADLAFMIEAAAQSAWSTDRGAPIVAGVIAALRTAKIILPAPAVIERIAIAGRARARKRAADALLAGLSPAQLAKLDALLIPDPAPRRDAVRVAAKCSNRREARSRAGAARSALSGPRERRPRGSGRTDP